MVGTIGKGLNAVSVGDDFVVGVVVSGDDLLFELSFEGGKLGGSSRRNAFYGANDAVELNSEVGAFGDSLVGNDSDLT